MYDLFLPALWGFLVGLVFSTVGIAGAILASVGHISLFGIKDANVVKVYNQSLVILSGFISSPLYIKQGRSITLLAFLLGTGSIIGAFVGSSLSYTHLSDLKRYKFLIGLLTLSIAIKLIHDAFYNKGELNRNGLIRKVTTKLKGMKLQVFSEGYHTSFSTLLPLTAGFLIAVVSSALGIGGGFLIVPFMLFILKIPVYFVPGTAIMTVLITTLTSAGNYLRLGVNPDFYFLASESIGVFLGSLVGPFLSKRLGERKLKLAIGLILLYIGIGYTLGDWLKTSFGIRII